MKKCDYVQFLDRLVKPCILPLVLVTADPASFPALMRLWHHASTESQSLLDKIGRTGFAVSSESSTPATKWPKYEPSARQTISSYNRSRRHERRTTQHDYKHKYRLLAETEVQQTHREWQLCPDCVEKLSGADAVIILLLITPY